MGKGDRPALADGRALSFESRLVRTLSARARHAGVPVTYLVPEEVEALLRRLLRLAPDLGGALELTIDAGRLRTRVVGLAEMGAALSSLDLGQVPADPTPPRQRPRRPSRL